MSQPSEEERRVLPFAVPPGRPRRRLVADPSGRGAVLLFTGVRYERAGPQPPILPRDSAPPPDPRRGV